MGGSRGNIAAANLNSKLKLAGLIKLSALEFISGHDLRVFCVVFACKLLPSFITNRGMGETR